MRRFFALCLALVPVSTGAWEFRADPICTLLDDGPSARTRITFDPGPGLYSLTITRIAGVWLADPRFGITFHGGMPLTIGTDRHRIEGPGLIVSDRGFGNVLNGLEFNSVATAFTGAQSVEIPLAGAAGPVRAFRACAEAPPPTS